MGRIRRSFDVQFKIRICEAVEAGSNTIPDLCREYQLQRAMIEGWLKLYLRGDFHAKQGNGPGELEREVERLRAKVGELTMQIDSLKKAHKLSRETKSESEWKVSGGSLDPKGKPAGPVVLLPAPSTTGKRDRK